MAGKGKSGGKSASVAALEKDAEVEVDASVEMLFGGEEVEGNVECVSSVPIVEEDSEGEEIAVEVTDEVDIADAAEREDKVSTLQSGKREMAATLTCGCLCRLLATLTE
jgi:hypothetical protein